MFTFDREQHNRAGQRLPAAPGRWSGAVRRAGCGGALAQDFAHPMVTVAVPARNAQATIGEQLAALAAQDYEKVWEIVVVDNGSTDATVDVVKTWADRLRSLRVVSAENAVGINHARNAAMTSARSDLVAFCDADDIVDPGWLRAIVSAAGHADAVGGRLEYDRLNPDHVRAMRPEPPMHDVPRAADFLPRAVGANFAVRRKVWQDLGGFDEAYQRGATETEFFWRLQLAGYSLEFAPDAVVHYRFRSGQRTLFRQFARFGRAQAQLYRHFRHAGMPRTSPSSFLRDAVWLLLHVNDLHRDATTRGRWIRTAATRWGRLRGSVRFRVFYL